MARGIAFEDEVLKLERSMSFTSGLIFIVGSGRGSRVSCSLAYRDGWRKWRSPKVHELTPLEVADLCHHHITQCVRRC